MSKSMKIRRINFEKVCRACLIEKNNLRDIYSTKIPKMIESCASVLVCENDGLPRRICVSCFHSITKLYTFKKKLERSDRILRQYLKFSKVKHSNIIDIAVTEAEINDIVYINDDSISKDDDVELSDDNMPLSKHITKRESQIVNKDMISKNVLQELDLSESNLEDFKSGDTVQIFTDGPPPLVPLAPVKDINYTEYIVKDLPRDTPPLIPIKPLVNINVLENIIEQNNGIKFKCSICNTEFTSLIDLKKHKLNSCKPNGLSCVICNKEFKDSKKLIGHLIGHKVAKHYRCKICTKRYPNPSTFTVHMRTHTGERPFKCQICGKGFIRWAGVVGHMKTHQKDKPFKCETCGRCFKISCNLERHKMLHSGNLPYSCSHCGKCFRQSDNLQLHIRTYHTNERPFLCSECGKGFVNSTRLNRHMWVHSGYKPYVCSHCSKAYSNSHDLKNHERKHQNKTSDEDKSYACNHCNMKFYHLCRLLQHKKTHEKSHMTYRICHICHKIFSSDNTLTKHIENKHGMTYMEESVLQPDEGVSQIFVQYHPQENKEAETVLEYEKISSLEMEKSNSEFFE